MLVAAKKITETPSSVVEKHSLRIFKRFGEHENLRVFRCFNQQEKTRNLLLMAEILHQLIGSFSMFFPLSVGFQHHPRWLGMGYQPSTVLHENSTLGRMDTPSEARRSLDRKRKKSTVLGEKLLPGLVGNWFHMVHFEI